MRLYPCAASARNSASVMALRQVASTRCNGCGARLRTGRRWRRTVSGAIAVVHRHPVDSDGRRCGRSGRSSSRIRRNETDAVGDRGERRNYTIGIEVLHRLALVVAIRHDQHGAAGGARRLGIVDRSRRPSAVGSPAHAEASPRRGEAAQDPASSRADRRRRPTSVEITRDPRALEVRPDEARCLVGDDRERKAHRDKPVEPLDHPRKRQRLAAEKRRVVRLIARERVARLRRSSSASGDTPVACASARRTRLRHALADHRADGRPSAPAAIRARRAAR